MIKGKAGFADKISDCSATLKRIRSEVLHQKPEKILQGSPYRERAHRRLVDHLNQVVDMGSDGGAQNKIILYFNSRNIGPDALTPRSISAWRIKLVHKSALCCHFRGN